MIFFWSAIAIAAAAPAPAAPAKADGVRKATVYFLASEELARAFDGIRTAVAENERPARAAGFSLTAARLEGGQALAETFAQGGRFFIVAGDEKDVLDAVNTVGANAIVVNVSSSSDALRSGCRANLLHTAPSQEMEQRALAEAGAAASAKVAAWTNDADRFAAGQLRSRFERSAGRPMTEADWLAWIAADMILKAGVAARSYDADAVMKELKAMRFHTYKGPPASLSDDGQLSQSLFVLEGADQTWIPAVAGGDC